MESNKIIWSVVSLVVLSTIVISYGTPQSQNRQNLRQPEMTPTQETKDTRDLTKFGTVDYNAPAIEDSHEWEKRRQISQRYDNQDWVYKTINNPQTAGVGKVTDDPAPPLLPTDESPLVVIGEVVLANAYLSNDKSGVYTEFTIRLDELLKNKAEKGNPKKVIADREGGVVRYPNGQRVLYQSSELGLPQVGSIYLFFLVKDDQSPNYKILTSYDVSGNRIHQMEMGRSFDEFKDASKEAFIQSVRNKIARPRS